MHAKDFSCIARDSMGIQFRPRKIKPNIIGTNERINEDLRNMFILSEMDVRFKAHFNARDEKGTKSNINMKIPRSHFQLLIFSNRIIRVARLKMGHSLLIFCLTFICQNHTTNDSFVIVAFVDQFKLMESVEFSRTNE